MVPHIGIRVEGLPTLGELLLFDKIAIVHPPLALLPDLPPVVQHIYSTWGIGGVHQNYNADDVRAYEKLREYGLVYDVMQVLGDSVYANQFIQHLQGLWNFLLEATEAREKDARSRNKRHLKSFLRKYPELRNLDPEGANERLLYRPLRELIAKEHQCVATSIVNQNNITISVPSSAPARFSRADALSLVLKRFPVVDPTTVLAQVREFRSDESARRSLRRLRKLMSDLAERHDNVLEITEELQSMIDEYAERMENHRMRFVRKSVGFVLTASSEVIRELTHLSLPTTLESAIQFCRSFFALNDSECSASGSEVAYILECTRKFGPKIAGK